MEIKKQENLKENTNEKLTYIKSIKESNISQDEDELKKKEKELKKQRLKNKYDKILSREKHLLVSEKTYDSTMTLLKLHEFQKSNNVKEENKNNKDEKSDIKSYDKWEKMYQEIDLNEIITNPLTKNILQTQNRNDIRKNKQIFEAPYVTKLEACIVFKNKADQLLKSFKDYDQAFKIYNEAISYLFITNYNEDEDMTVKQKEIKNTIFMNMSVCKINKNNQKDYLLAIDYLNDCFIHNNKNVKCVYRIAHCYISIKEYEKSNEWIQKGLLIDANNQELLKLKKEVENSVKKIEEDQKKAFRKIMNGGKS